MTDKNGFMLGFFAAGLGALLAISVGRFACEPRTDTELLARMTNEIVQWRGEYMRLGANYNENQRHLTEVVAGVQNFLTNCHISELEIGPGRISTFKTNVVYDTLWRFEVTPTNVIAVKQLPGFREWSQRMQKVIGNGNTVSGGDITVEKP